MKKFTKVCLIVSAVSLLLGTGITAASASMGGRLSDLPSYCGNRWIGWNSWNHRYFWGGWNDSWDEWNNSWDSAQEDWDDAWEDFDEEINNMPNEVYTSIGSDMEDIKEEISVYWDEPFNIAETKEFTGVKDLDVSVSAGGVQLITVQDEDARAQGRITVKMGEGSGTYQMDMDENGELNIAARIRAGHRSGKGRRIQIEIPEGYQFEDIDIEIAGGAIDAEKLLAKELNIKLSAGDVEIRDGNVEKLDGKLSAGNFLYRGDVGQEIDVKCNMGKIDLKLAGEKEDYDYKVSASAGSINIGGETYNGVGKQYSDSTGASKKMELQCNLGDIRVEFQD